MPMRGSAPDVWVSDYVVYFPQTTDRRKTSRWLIRSVHGAGFCLGHVSWYSPWRRYGFYPSTLTVYDPACLRDIADFCEGRTKDHKEGRL